MVYCLVNLLANIAMKMAISGCEGQDFGGLFEVQHLGEGKDFAAIALQDIPKFTVLL